MPYKPVEIKKLYYTVGDVSKMYNVNASLVRFWDKEFDEIKPKKNKKGNRLFSEKDLETFALIYHLVKERGFTLQGAKDKLREDKIKTEQNFQTVKKLEKVKEFLLDLKSQL